MPVITQLNVYPVKSMQGTRLPEGVLTARGLQYDRNWMVIDTAGKFITQRALPEMASIKVTLRADHLHLQRGGDEMYVSIADSQKKPVVTEVWGDTCEAFDEGDGISEWLSDILGRRGIRLVRFNRSFKRSVDTSYLKGEDAHTAFADGFPFLITTEESLSRLNDRLAGDGAHPITMDRFRPNIVIKGLQPFRENEIEELRTTGGSIRLGIRKPCKRCKITTVDQETGTIWNRKEPLRTLAAMKTVPELHGAYFGQNATLVAGEGEVIRQGDRLETAATM